MGTLWDVASAAEELQQWENIYFSRRKTVRSFQIFSKIKVPVVARNCASFSAKEAFITCRKHTRTSRSARMRNKHATQTEKSVCSSVFVVV